MAFVLKKINTKKGLYLSIYFNEYKPDLKQNRNHSYKSLGYVDDLKKHGIKEPLVYAKSLVDELNNDLNKVPQIGETSNQKNLGYFLINGAFEHLKLKPTFDILTSTYNPQFDKYKLFKNLIFSQIISPGSKHQAYEKVIASLYDGATYSYDQILDMVNFIGSDYQKYIELLNIGINNEFKRDTSNVYFDCTNYYFEIDLEDDLRRKGPSKENRKDPIIGQALMLDSNQIPIAMRMYPGNQSEKPFIRKMIEDMKERYDINGKTIQIADKGLNCAKNIYYASIAGKDGYIFSKSIHGKNLITQEKKWILTKDNDINKWTIVKDKKGEEKYRYKSDVSDYNYSFYDDDGEKIDFKIKEKRVVTFNPSLAKKKRLEIMKEVENLKANFSFKGVERKEFGDAVKYVKLKETEAKLKLELDENKINEDLQYAGYNLLITSETNMKEEEIYEAYHGLWKIENSFRIMKTYLEARPVFLQKEESIYGHFLICYYALTLLRLLEKYAFSSELSSEEIITFIRQYNITHQGNGIYINNSTKSKTYEKIKEKLQLTKLGNLSLKPKDINNILKAEIFL